MRRVLLFLIVVSISMSGFLTGEPAFAYYCLPPELTCPDNDSIHATETFVSTGFSAYDPDGDPVEVSFLDINPPATISPAIVGYHVEWATTCEEDGDYLIRLVATDSCGLADTCGFTVHVYNLPPEITCPEDDSVHAGDTFLSTDFSVFDPDGDFISVYFLDITPQPTHYPTIVDSHVVWQTTCDDVGVYVIRLVASEMCQPADTCGFTVTVYNEPPDLICPPDDSANAGYLFASGDFSVSDWDDPSGVVVTLYSISPTPVNPPEIVDSHIEWLTTCEDLVNGPDYVITLMATDPCGLTSTCDFTVTVYNEPPEIICPDDASVHAGDYFISTDFSASDPRGEAVEVSLCGVTPPPTEMPTIVENHLEWQTHCADAGKVFEICLEAVDTCGSRDTCHFNVTVYNQPPDLTCPDSGSVHAGDDFVSTDFSVSDPEGDPVSVALCGIDPTPVHMPGIVGNHVEWQTECADANKIFTICLEAEDSCGAKSTCYFQVRVYNRPPEIFCPVDGDVHSGETFVSGDFSATDPDDDPVDVTLLDIVPVPTNQPQIVGSHVEWLTTCAEKGSYLIRLVATDECGLKDTCGFTVNVYNNPPQLICPPDGSVEAGQTFTSDDFSASDPDGDAVVVTFQSISAATTYDPAIVGNHVEWLTASDEEGTYAITLRVTDPCGLFTECTFYVNVMPPPEGENKVWIGEIDCVNPGDYVSLPVYLVNNSVPFGGFELEFEFDYTSLCFVDAMPGNLLEDSYTDQDGIFWSWEYFTYRVLPCPIPPCQKYKILVYGQAEMPNGSTNRGLCIPENSNGVLFYINFVVMNDENLRGFMIPVCFEWEGMVVDDIVVEDWECTENIFASCDGNTIYTSSLLCEFNPDVCDHPGGDIQRTMVFQAAVCGINCGGILVCPIGPDFCKRGDVNYNTVSYEVADAVLFANYFVYGHGVFIHDRDYQVCATDANADGRTLTLSDLVYLIRVILNDAVEIPKLTPSSEAVDVIVSGGTITAQCSVPIGAMLFEFDGAVSAALLAEMEMLHNGDRVLLWSRDGSSLTAAEVLSFSGAGLVSVSAVDRDSRELKTSMTARVAPTAFALNPAYPNPFNPYTNMSFVLPEATSYSLKIYNVAGQLVRSYEGVASADLNVITWDGRDNAGTEVASGVYFYKLTAASFSAAEKMVMMK
jgi:hypothetical protein